MAYSRYLSLSLPNDLNRNPLKTRIPARAEAEMVCCCGIPIINAITKVTAAAKEPSGIHNLTASVDLFPEGAIPKFYTILLLYHWMPAQSLIIYFIPRNFIITILWISSRDLYIPALNS